MATTKQQEIAFKKEMSEALPVSFLGSMLDWIRDNLQPDEVFEQTRLNKFVSDVSQPEDVFYEEELKQWAIDKGFTAPVKKDPILSYAHVKEE